MRPEEVVANRFQIESIAGTGGMGTVYRARDLAAGGLVALKTLAGIGERDAARFAREAAVLAELSHPGIVRYVAHGLTSEHEHYIAMEWLEGETLHERLRRGRMPLAEAIAVGRAAAEAIAAAHQRGVVHRDLKPMNLFLASGDVTRVKVLDFGIARHMHHAGLLTHTGAVIGTPGYMAPEQVRGETTVDARTDVFSLGCVLYRCITGVSAFGGDQSLAVLAKILVEDVQPPSSIVAIPAALDDLVLRMLAKQPAARPPNGRAVAEALARLADATAKPTPAAVDITLRDGSGHSGYESAAPTTDHALDTVSNTGARAAITASEQRLVSVVLSGPLRDGELTDPDRLVIAATAFGGRLERLADGANLVLFAHADVATDHAVRAARCALALRDMVPGAGFVVASGRASVARSIVGDVIDRAVTIVRTAVTGQIVIDTATAGLLDQRFVVTERGERRYLRGMRDAQEPLRTLLGKAPPLVGRDRELGNLESLWIESADEQVARAVLVTAPPGGGKSRLRQELVRRVLQRDEHAELLIGRGDSLRAGSPFAMIADTIRRAAGVREGDALGDQRAALRARVTRHVDEGDADRVTHLLGELAGVAFPSDASEALRAARADPRVKGDAMRMAWIDWLVAETRHHPVLFVLEDLHWGDRATIELADAALRELSQAPFMLVALARPEIHDTFPRLWAARALQEIRLPQLSKKASVRLVRDLLGIEVAPGTVNRIVERAGGNAFFLEELIRAVAEGRGDSLPDSVLSVLQLRLDALGGDTKRVLRAASVFGEVFWRGGVAMLLGSDPREQLELVIQRELVAVAPESKVPGDVEYAFRHDLVREAAYATMNITDRVAAHRLAGEWLVSHGFGDSLALAGQFSRGEQPERAARYYARAASQAFAGNDYLAALSHAELGRACAPSGLVAAELHLICAEALNWRGEHAAGSAAADQARAVFRRGSQHWFEASDELFFAAGRCGDIARALRTLHDLTTTIPEPEAVLGQIHSVTRAAIVMLRFGPEGVGPAVARRAEELAAASRATLDLTAEHRLNTMRAFAARSCGDVQLSLEANEAALHACELSHNHRELAFTHLSLAGCYDELGAPELALPLLRNGIAIAERIGAVTVTPLLQFSLALCEVELGMFDEARSDAQRALDGCTGHDRASEGLSRWVLGRVALETDDLATAERELDAAIRALDSFTDWHAAALASRARLHLQRGELAEARRTASHAKATVRLQDGFQDGEAFVRLVELEVLEASGDRAALREAADAAIARLELRAARLVEPWRERWLAKPDHVATLARR